MVEAGELLREVGACLGMHVSRRMLRAQNALIARRVARLERAVTRLGGGIHQMLRRRGLKLHRKIAPERLLVHQGMSPQAKEEFYRLMHSYSFRLWLRDLIKLRQGEAPEAICSYCSAASSRQYMDALSQMGLVETSRGGSWRLLREGVTSFGETLEWFVAEIFRREFCAQAIHGVSFRSPPPGGDFDVLAALEGLLVYVECKSSPPRGIEAEEVAGFLGRCRLLAPHLALFLVDTHLRMLDKMVPILEELLGGAPRDSGVTPQKVQRLEREIFHVQHRLYVLNSGRRLAGNLRSCLMDFLREQSCVPGAIGLGTCRLDEKALI